MARVFSRLRGAMIDCQCATLLCGNQGARKLSTTTTSNRQRYLAARARTAPRRERGLDLRGGREERKPRPSLEPTNSPITLRLRRRQRDLGTGHHERQRRRKLDLDDICHREARRLRASSSSSRGVDCSPAEVSTTIGKNATSHAIASLDSMPMPNHTRRIGASATFGTDCSAIRIGENMRFSVSEFDTATAIGIPSASARKNRTASPSALPSSPRAAGPNVPPRPLVPVRGRECGRRDLELHADPVPQQQTQHDSKRRIDQPLQCSTPRARLARFASSVKRGLKRVCGDRG